MSREVGVRVVDDTLKEQPEDFYVYLSRAVNLTIDLTRQRGKITIIDNDGTLAPNPL